MCLSWLKLSKTKDLELLTSVIKEYYSFLGDTEIKNFLSLHPQLRKERDFSVVEACLEKYLRHEAQKYNVLLSSYEAAHKEDRFTTNDDQPLLRRIDKKSKKKIKAETKYTADEIERANFLAAKHERRLDSNPNLYIGTKTSAYYKNPRGTYKNEPNEIISSKISEDNQRPNYVAEAELDNASLKQRNPQKEGLKDKKPEDNNGQGLYLDPIREENKGEESRNTRLELGEAICTQGKVEEDSTLPSDSVEEEEQVKEYRKRMREKFNYGLEAEENPVVQSYNFRRMGEEEVIPIIEQRRRQMLAAGITDTDELLSSDPRVQLAMEHSKNMAEGKVPFSHEGFGERCKKFSRYRYRVGRMAENVACSFGAACVAETAVEGWIESPGHKANLVLRDVKYCAIACYRSYNGTWYLTQMFA